MDDNRNSRNVKETVMSGLRWFLLITKGTGIISKTKRVLDTRYVRSKFVYPFLNYGIETNLCAVQISRQMERYCPCFLYVGLSVRPFQLQVRRILNQLYRDYL